MRRCVWKSMSNWMEPQWERAESLLAPPDTKTSFVLGSQIPQEKGVSILSSSCPDLGSFSKGFQQDENMSVSLHGSSPPHTESLLKNSVEKSLLPVSCLVWSRRPHATLMVPWDGRRLANLGPGRSWNGWSWNIRKPSSPETAVGSCRQERSN